MQQNREQFSSKTGFILAAAGSAVGIGNLVGFPVAATKNGGGAFLVIYAFFVFVICLPVMLAEMSLGRKTKKDPFGAFRQLAPQHLGWTLAGFLSVLTPFMIAVFYMVITIWIFSYLIATAMGDLTLLATETHFSGMVSSTHQFYAMIGVVLIVGFILKGGVKHGIEKAASILMPMLFVLLLGLVFFVLTLDNAFSGVKFYILPDFSKLNIAVVSAALSQAFFSLSLGMGIMITYGSYLSQKESIPSSAKVVALTDTLVAFFAGLMVIPAIYSFNPNTQASDLSDSSISLIFNYLPKILLALQDSIGYLAASILAVVFFLLVFFAAITSLVSIMQVPIACLSEATQWKQRKSMMVYFIFVVIFTVLAAISFGLSPALTELVDYAGKPHSLFDIIIDVFYDTILPLNGALVCLFVVYRWRKASFDEELQQGDLAYKNSWFRRYVNISLTVFIPLILLVIFFNTVALKFFGIDFISG